MADDEQFSLCWNNFNSNLSAGFHESLCRGDLVDVTLAAEGQFVKAHRLVLSVCSPYFRKMFTQMPANQHAFVFLKDVSHSALKDLIQFMYCGEVNVKQDALPAFISTAEALQIKGLTDGEPAPSQSPAKPSTPAPQQTIPAPSMSATSPRVRTQRSSTTRTYKLESEDSGDDKQQIVLQSQTQQIVQQPQKRPAQRSITPHTVPSVKRVKNSDPLEATDPTQIAVQSVADNKSTSGEAEFIDLPMDLPTKSEPDYAEDAGDVETAEQEATYVEDDSYGDMKYDESYFTENDETAATTAAPTTSSSTTVKAQTGTFSESYVSDTGDQSATEAQEKRTQLQLLDVDSSGQMLNRIYPEYIMAEKKVIKTEIIEIEESQMNLPSVCDKPKTQTPIPTNPPEVCDNCQKCICRNWRWNLTPQFVTMFEDMLYAIKNCVMKNTPMTNLDMEIELYPGTGVWLVKRQILMAVSQAKGNQRAMIRNLLTAIFTEQELLDFDTGEKLYQAESDVFLAISEYLKSNHNIEITKSEFVNVINHKIGEWKSKRRLTEEELKKKAEEKKLKARVNRQKRKVENQKISKKSPQKT